jgi:hypothetical protein
MQPKLLAQITNPLLKVLGVGGTPNGPALIAVLIAQLLTAFFIIGAVALIFMILWSGVQWITAGDNADSLKSAQKRLTGAIIGFALLASAFALVKLIGFFFGIEFLQTLIVSWPTLTP